MCSAFDVEGGSRDPPPATDTSRFPSARAGEAGPAVAHPVRATCADFLAAAAAGDNDGAWGTLLAAIGLANDPGAAAPLVEAIAEILAAFDDNDRASHPLASLKPVVAAVLAHPSWNDGTWRRTANRSRRGGRHSGNVDERPLLACLVADRRATTERPALNALRLLILAFLMRGGETTGAVVHVADAVRKAESMEVWRQVVRAMPRADGPGLAQTAWLGALSIYLGKAEPPTDLAQAPAVSIRTFFLSLQSLIRHVTQQPAQRQQRSLFDEEDAQPRGEIRTRSPSPDPAAASRSRRRTASNDPVAERRHPVQEVLVFEEDAQDDGPALVPMVTNPGLAPIEQPQAIRSECLAFRLRSYRLTEISQRLRWSWDHLNTLDIQVLVASIRADLLSAMSYHVSWVSPPGKDGGIDILAWPDPLGTRLPRIKVQVKRQQTAVNVDGLRSFMALLSDDDVGLFVCTGGFTKDAESEARTQEKRRVTLIGLERLFDLWVEHYKALSEVAQARLPLRPIYFRALKG